MRTSFRGLVAALALAAAPAAAAPAAAAAQPLTFDDLPVATPVSPLVPPDFQPRPYGGLEFAGFFVGSADAAPFLGTIGAGAVSATQFAYVGQNLPFGAGEIYSPTYDIDQFTGFLGIRSASGATTGTVTVRGFDTFGVEVFMQALTLGASSTLFAFATPRVDALEFDVTALDGSTYLVLDDVAISTVPEPATVVLLATGLAAIGGVARIRRRAAA